MSDPGWGLGYKVSHGSLVQAPQCQHDDVMSARSAPTRQIPPPQHTHTHTHTAPTSEAGFYCHHRQQHQRGSFHTPPPPPSPTSRPPEAARRLARPAPPAAPPDHLPLRPVCKLGQHLQHGQALARNHDGALGRGLHGGGALVTDVGYLAKAGRRHDVDARLVVLDRTKLSKLGLQHLHRHLVLGGAGGRGRGGGGQGGCAGTRWGKAGVVLSSR